MQIGSATSFLNSVGQALSPASGVNPVKTAPTDDQDSDKKQVAAEATASAPAQASQASGNGRRGGLINLVV